MTTLRCRCSTRSGATAELPAGATASKHWQRSSTGVTSKLQPKPCAVLRAEVVKRKEEAERERNLRSEAAARLKELEEKFSLLGARAIHMLGVKEQALEQEVAVTTLKQCYREAREEIDELRMLQAEQNLQVQDYRAKYQRAQQTIEEQKRQLSLQDMDNQRIADQINLEIQRIKLKFQEKLSELSPLPAVLKHTQRRLMEAQQSQALAEHKADSLARELATAREKLHMLLHTITKPPPEKGPEKNYDEKMVAQAQARAAQLAETNATLKQEIERLKLNVIRMEETVMLTDKRLQEKMHECAALGGELERARDHATREVLLANQRADTARACLESTATEMERRLAAANRALAAAELDRDEAPAGAYPGACALLDSSLAPRCSCTVLATRWALTAAHCAKPEVAYVQFNGRDRSDSNLATVKLVYAHPSFEAVVRDLGEGPDVVTLQHDLGLVRTRSNMVLSSYSYFPVPRAPRTNGDIVSGMMLYHIEDLIDKDHVRVKIRSMKRLRKYYSKAPQRSISSRINLRYCQNLHVTYLFLYHKTDYTSHIFYFEFFYYKPVRPLNMVLRTGYN
ncbi:ribosome-binding protein 1-like [Cydia pomonella]|uniref:ribosome-binding protein 1-like n=1 Tax=Cydia pomonella TaxID=82600 RepID=UPI002ADE3050|nr:ribosome-binding protein 1-like [Cydia pomonella]